MRVMKKAKTYWDEIKSNETHFYGGTQGWEVYLRQAEHVRWNSETNQTSITYSLELDFPFRAGDGVPAVEKALCRKQVKFQQRKRKLLAQAASNQEEYRELNSRVSGLSDEEFDAIIKMGFKGFALRDHIRYNHLTYGEAHSLFYRM